MFASILTLTTIYINIISNIIRQIINLRLFGYLYISSCCYSWQLWKLQYSQFYFSHYYSSFLYKRLQYCSEARVQFCSFIQASAVKGFEISENISSSLIIWFLYAFSARGFLVYHLYLIKWGLGGCLESVF